MMTGDWALHLERLTGINSDFLIRRGFGPPPRDGFAIFPRGCGRRPLVLPVVFRRGFGPPPRDGFSF
jgi:hypothetical protein